MRSRTTNLEASNDDDLVEVLDRDGADQARVQEALVFIRASLDRTLYQGVSTIGEYLLKTFFDDDPEQVSSRSPYKNASFRALAEWCGTPELPISKSWLHNAVAVAVMRRLLGDSLSFRRLSPSHQLAFLPLCRDPEKVERLAERVLSKRLSVRDLRRAVADETNVGRARRGRVPKSTIQKTLERSLRLLTADGTPTKADVTGLDKEAAQRALTAAHDLMRRLAELVEQLEAHSP
jgi:hypothetical protein